MHRYIAQTAVGSHKAHRFDKQRELACSTCGKEFCRFGSLLCLIFVVCKGFLCIDFSGYLMTIGTVLSDLRPPSASSKQTEYACGVAGSNLPTLFHQSVIQKTNVN